MQTAGKTTYLELECYEHRSSGVVNVGRVQQISPIHEKTFLVGDVMTIFSIRTAQFEALLQPANELLVSPCAAATESTRAVS